MKTFVVIGGTSGLGFEVARLLAPEHRVVVVGDRVDEVKNVAADLGCDGLTCDVSRYDQVERAFDEIAMRGAVHGVAHCAAMWAGGALDELAPETIRRAVEVNVLGPTYVLREALRRMRAQGFGNAVYVGAVAVDAARPGIPVYRATKSYGKSLVESVAQATGSNEVKLMQVHPGPMPTRLQERVGDSFLDTVYTPPAAVAREIVRLLLLAPEDPYVSDLRVLQANGRW
ncbi:SDR family NAD(P)-dependent oxidoreductase [Phytohabitans sp. ZYX-F-186]|uniref:SDR family NAD(P)-dependent oxidoreductase n=1 Tax=Phytohabitans maris TaxID=3071409 RepID=A0ABU0ZXK1_9ACTN|nr:SDR family NAD(P)-dependent oxidoreductase [Phytohabitans sp. ZYX-F-186]MDQ7910702.1 SDR family NAD(P)-dependent oxidoreductase [Phytohabitans sp. ZYX-F-186]